MGCSRFNILVLILSVSFFVTTHGFSKTFPGGALINEIGQKLKLLNPFSFLGAREKDDAADASRSGRISAYNPLSFKRQGENGPDKIVLDATPIVFGGSALSEPESFAGSSVIEVNY